MTKLVRKRNVVSVRLGDRAFAELSNARPIMMAWYRSLVSDARAATSQLAANRSHNWLFAAHTGSQYLLALGLPAARLAGVLDNNQAKIGSRMYGSTLWVHAPSVIAGLRAPRVLLRQGVYNAELRTQLLAINPSCVIITGGAEPLASASDDVATSSAATTKYHRSTPLLAPRTVKGRRGGGRASGRLEVGEASSNFSAYYWTAAGCPQETVRAGAARVAKRPAPKARCEHASNVAAIRCCGGSHHSGGKCVSLCGIAVKKFSSGLAATHGEAVSACAAHGMRLCSLEELASQICCRTGCLMDGRRVWTNGACSARECHEGTPGTIVDALDGTEDTGGGDDAPLHCQRTERAREAGPNWCSALDSATAEALQGTAVVACVNIKDLGIGSELYGLYGALTLLRAWHSEHPETLVALQEPQLMDYDGGGGDGDNLRLTDLLNVSLLRDALPPTVRWLPPNIQPCSLLDNEISFTSNGLAVSPLLTSNGLAVRSSLGRKGLAGVSGLGLGTTIPEMWRHVRTWRQTSNCPARIFIGGNNYGPSACAITAQTSAARLVANAMSFRVPSSLEAISERVRTHARHCAYYYVREAPSAEMTLSMGLPYPGGAAGNCHNCGRHSVRLRAVGKVIAAAVAAEGLSCVGVNSLPPKGGRGDNEVLRTLASGAQAAGHNVSFVSLRHSRPADAPVSYDPALIQMYLATQSLLLITERGTLNTDRVVSARVREGKPSFALYTLGTKGTTSSARGSVRSRATPDVEVDKTISACRGAIVRGSCIAQGREACPKAAELKLGLFCNC